MTPSVQDVRAQLRGLLAPQPGPAWRELEARLAHADAAVRDHAAAAVINLSLEGIESRMNPGLVARWRALLERALRHRGQHAAVRALKTEWRKP